MVHTSLLHKTPYGGKIPCTIYCSVGRSKSKKQKAKQKSIKFCFLLRSKANFTCFAFCFHSKAKKKCFFAFAFLGKQSIFQQISKIQKTEEITPIYKNDQKYQSKISQKCHSYKTSCFCFLWKSKKQILFALLFAFMSKQKINCFCFLLRSKFLSLLRFLLFNRSKK